MRFIARNFAKVGGKRMVMEKTRYDALQNKLNILKRIGKFLVRRNCRAAMLSRTTD